MGSSILAYPAMREAKRLWPHAQLYFLIFHEIQDSVHLLDMMPQGHVLTIRSKSLWAFLWDILRFPFLCRKYHIDAVVDLEYFSRLTAIVTVLSGASRASGFYRFHMEGMYRGNLYTHRVQFNGHVHAAVAYLSLTRALVRPADEVPLVKESVQAWDLRLPVLPIDADRKRAMHEKLRRLYPKLTERNRLVIVNPNSSFLITVRRWPLEQYAALVKKLVQMEDVVVVLTGVQSEKANAAFIRQRVPDSRVIDFTGETTMAELVDLYHVADLLITNDSGPAQFAALTKIPILVFFGPETPERFKPLSERAHVLYSHFACSPCVSPFNQLHSPCTNNLCLKTISVDTVYRKAVEIFRVNAPL